MKISSGFTEDGEGEEKSLQVMEGSSPGLGHRGGYV